MLKEGSALDGVVAEYFRRVQYTGPADATLDTLGALVSAHTRCIPFENVDSLLGRPVADLCPEVLIDKLVRHRRGGFCYEQNGLLGFVLEELGFEVNHIGARVLSSDGANGALSPENHDVLRMTVPGVEGQFLVDVGFGGPTPTAPLRFVTGTVQQTPHGAYRLLGQSGGCVLQGQVGDDWKSLYVFTTHPRVRIDLEVGSWYMSTHPKSLFVTAVTAAIVTDDVRYNLRGRNLAVHRRGATEHVRLDDADEVLNLLSTRFGIGLTDAGDRATLQARVSEVLDA